MRKIDKLNQLQAEMMEARTTVEQLCADWGWTISDKEATIVTNEITINKGKIVAIETTNDNEETIAMLRETIRKQNEVINDMNKQIEELKAQVATKDKEYQDLIDEYGEAVDEDIAINQGLKDVIEDLKAQLETKDNNIEGIRAGYEAQIAKLKEEASKPRITVVDDPDYNEPKKVAPKTAPKITVFNLRLTKDGCVRGETKDYEFVWNPERNDIPAYKLNGTKAWRPMKDRYSDALYLKQLIIDEFFTEKQEDEIPEETNEIVVNNTNDNGVFAADEEDPLAWADDLDVR